LRSDQLERRDAIVLTTRDDEDRTTRAAPADDLQAKFEYGLKVLDDPRAGAEGARAIELIDEAARLGHAEATATCALFEAMGALRPQSWSRALDLLQRAAELGSEPAQGQLRVLGEDSSADKQDAGDSDDWSAIRSRIAPEQLLRAPPGRKLSDAPRVVAYAGFATPAECRWIIERAKVRLQPAQVFSEEGIGQSYNLARDNSAVSFKLSDVDVVMELLRARIAVATRLPVPLFEPSQILHYSVGEQFRPHHDFLDPGIPGYEDHLRTFGQRIATFLVYLNDGYEGGETVFPKICLSYRGNTGDALFFTNVDRTGRGDPLSLHSGIPPTSGEKWVFSQWIRDKLPPTPSSSC